MTLWKGVYYRENQNIDWEFQSLFKVDLILLANAPTDSSLCILSLRVSPIVLVSFVVGGLVLH